MLNAEFLPTCNICKKEGTHPVSLFSSDDDENDQHKLITFSQNQIVRRRKKAYKSFSKWLRKNQIPGIKNLRNGKLRIKILRFSLFLIFIQSDSHQGVGGKMIIMLPICAIRY